MMIEFLMSCGHFETYDCSTTGKQFQIDKEYNRTQGLCKECWKKLIEQHEKARMEQQKARMAYKTDKEGDT